MTKFKINVTKEVLEESKACNFMIGQNCAIAKAICRLFPNAWVEKSRINFYKNKDLQGNIIAKSLLPKIASSFIDDFDTKTPSERVLMEPISFDIEVPDRVINLIPIDDFYRILEESKTISVYE